MGPQNKIKPSDKAGRTVCFPTNEDIEEKKWKKKRLGVKRSLVLKLTIGSVFFGF